MNYYTAPILRQPAHHNRRNRHARPHQEHRHRRLIVVLAIAALALLVAAMVPVLWRQLHRLPLFTAPPASNEYQLAVWEWRSPDKLPGNDLANYMSWAANQKVVTIYLDIGAVTDINEITDPAEKARQLTAFDASVHQYVQAAHRSGIQVHGLAGSVQWAGQQYRYLPMQVLDYAADYNTRSSIEERLDAVQFDIEFYNQPGFKADKQQGMQDYLQTAAQLQSRLAELRQAGSGLRLGYAIPYWFDGQNGSLPAVSYDGSTKPVGFHLMDILNRVPHDYVAVMDYQDRAVGKSGSIARAQQEVDYAGSSAKNVDVIIGQLTGDSKPLSTTFYDDGASKLYQSLGQLQAHFQDSPNFGGLAVHDYRTFKKLAD